MLGLWLEGGKRHAKNVKNHLSKTKIHEYITYSKYTVHIFKECFWSFMAFWLLEKSCWLSFGPTSKTDYSAPAWGVSFSIHSTYIFQSWLGYNFWLQTKETIMKVLVRFKTLVEISKAKNLSLVVFVGFKSTESTYVLMSILTLFSK